LNLYTPPEPVGLNLYCLPEWVCQNLYSLPEWVCQNLYYLPELVGTIRFFFRGEGWIRFYPLFLVLLGYSMN